MDKPQLNYNEYLRYTFAGGIGILSFLYLNPQYFNHLFKSEGIKDSLFLVLASLIIGSFIYAFHRAIIYPIIYKINLLLLSIFTELKFKPELIVGIIIPFTTTKFERDLDFRRWKQRQNPKSFAKDLLDWSAQIHFLYCCVIAIFIVKLFSTNSNKETIEFIYDSGKAHFVYINILRNWHLLVLFIVAMMNHIRSLKYDVELAKRDIDFENYSMETKNDVTLIERGMSKLTNLEKIKPAETVPVESPVTEQPKQRNK